MDSSLGQTNTLASQYFPIFNVLLKKSESFVSLQNIATSIIMSLCVI